MAIPVHLVFMGLFLITPAFTYDREMTITVPAGKRECFFHYVEIGEYLKNRLSHQ